MKAIKTWFVNKLFKLGYKHAYSEMREYMKEIYSSPTWENDVWKFVNERI